MRPRTPAQLIKKLHQLAAELERVVIVDLDEAPASLQMPNGQRTLDHFREAVDRVAAAARELEDLSR